VDTAGHLPQLRITSSRPEVPCTLAHISPTSVYVYYYQVCKMCSMEPGSIDLHFAVCIDTSWRDTSWRPTSSYVIWVLIPWHRCALTGQAVCCVVAVEHPRILHTLRTTLELKLCQGRDYIVAENWYSDGICKGPSLRSVVDRRVQTALQRHLERLPAPFLWKNKSCKFQSTCLCSFGGMIDTKCDKKEIAVNCKPVYVEECIQFYN